MFSDDLESEGEGCLGLLQCFIPFYIFSFRTWFNLCWISICGWSHCCSSRCERLNLSVHVAAGEHGSFHMNWAYCVLQVKACFVFPFPRLTAPYGSTNDTRREASSWLQYLPFYHEGHPGLCNMSSVEFRNGFGSLRFCVFRADGSGLVVLVRSIMGAGRHQRGFIVGDGMKEKDLFDVVLYAIPNQVSTATPSI